MVQQRITECVGAFRNILHPLFAVTRVVWLMTIVFAGDYTRTSSGLPLLIHKLSGHRDNKQSDHSMDSTLPAHIIVIHSAFRNVPWHIPFRIPPEVAEQFEDLMCMLLLSRACAASQRRGGGGSIARAVRWWLDVLFQKIPYLRVHK